MNAIMDALKAFPAVAAIVGDKVFDYVPDTDAMPYIRYGVTLEGPFEATGVIGSDNEITIHGYCRSYNSVEARQLKKAIHDALADQLLPLASGYMIEMNFIDGQILQDDDGEQGSSHILSRFQAVTGEEP
jgi:hypothetical protein